MRKKYNGQKRVKKKKVSLYEKCAKEIHPISDFFATDPYHCPWTENPIYVFPEMKLRGLIPNSHIQVSVSHLYIPRIGAAANRKTDLTETWMWKLGDRPHCNSILEIKRPLSFISVNIVIGTRHLYYILTGPLFAVHTYYFFLECSRWLEYPIIARRFN